jgi:hypothetical protein
MKIGKPKRVWTVRPRENPVPHREPAPKPEPAPGPAPAPEPVAPDPEEVPAGP